MKQILPEIGKCMAKAIFFCGRHFEGIKMIVQQQIRGLIELTKSKHLVVSKLAPSGVAAHLIKGTTIHKWYVLDIEYNSTLEEG